ncbi:MAG: thioredoxin family protein [Labilithrix sp.]|nr:thioredoxin family protein [Labilithrix sp.]
MAWFRTRTSAAVGLSFLLAVTAACGGSSKPAATAGAGGSGESNDKGPAEVGKAAPDLSIQTVNGKGQVTRDSLQGKVAIVDFWATWCGPCKQSFPKLEELAKQNQGKVQVVGISVDDKSDGVADFAKSNGATFPIGWDDGHAIANRWKVDSMPTTYILDSSGTVRYIHAGYHDGEADAIAKELATLAAEPASGKGKTDVAASDKPATDKAASDSSGDKPAGDKPAGDKTAAGGDDSGDKTEETPPPKKKPAGKGGKKTPGKKPAGKPGPKKKPAAQ